MKLSTICFCLRENEVLLGMKKKGFGAGKWNGYGGKVRNSDYKIFSAARRELREESELRANRKRGTLVQFALINFFFAAKPVFECHIFVVKDEDLIGEPKETKEMKNHTWFPFDEVPFNNGKMWEADGLWMPLIFNGKKFKGTVRFDSKGEEVEDFSWEETSFS